MELIDNYKDCNFKVNIDKYINSNDWDNLSIQYVSDDITSKYKDKLNWSIIATNWIIDQEFYDKYKQQLKPFRYILKIRKQNGFISIHI